MKERDFIKQNQEKWQKFEKNQTNPLPETLAENFNQITSDLSYSRTHYPYRAIKVYLNEKAGSFFIDIYKTRKSNFKSFVNFWKYEIPSICYLHRKELYIAFAVFLVGFLVGTFSYYKDDSFASYILGQDYISMTEENIKNNDPMGVYKREERFGMFFWIAKNNIQVSFLIFAYGLLWGIGSLIDIFWESIRLACFLFFFVKRDIGYDSFTTIFMHTAIEICSIIIAGGAGFIMGKGLLFPGSYSRLQSFQISAKRAVKMILGLIPLFLFAAFNEGFITRLTDVNSHLRMMFVILCFLFVLLYFFIYPSIVVKKKEAQRYLQPEKINTVEELPEAKYGILKQEEIYNRAITFILSKAGRHAPFVFWASLLITGISYFTVPKDVYALGHTNPLEYWGIFYNWPMGRIDDLMNHKFMHFYYIIGIVVLALSASFATILQNTKWSSFLQIVLLTVISLSPTLSFPNYYILFFLFSGIYFLIMIIVAKESKNLFSAVFESFTLIGSQFMLFFITNGVFILVTFAIYLMVSSPIWQFVVFLGGFFFKEEEGLGLSFYFLSFIVTFIFLFSTLIIFSCNVFLYETIREVKYGNKIRAIMQKLSPTRRA